MSINRRHNTQTVPSPQEQPVARLVAIPKEPLGKVTKMERIGDALRRARLERGEDIHQIAEYLCIKPHFLQALENSHYDRFSADAYVIGFLRTYATFLGMDGKEAIDRYRYEMAGRRKKPVLSMPVPAAEGRAPSGLVLAVSLISAVLIYAMWYSVSSSNRARLSIPPSPPTLAQSAPQNDLNAPSGILLPSAAPLSTTTRIQSVVSEAPVPPALVEAKEEKEPQTKPSPPLDAASSVLTIRATQSSWVMITDQSSKALFDHVMKPGESFRVPSKNGLFLTTGNGAGIILNLNGVDLPLIDSGAPHTVRDISLDPNRLWSPRREAPQQH